MSTKMPTNVEIVVSGAVMIVIWVTTILIGVLT